MSNIINFPVNSKQLVNEHLKKLADEINLQSKSIKRPVFYFAEGGDPEIEKLNKKAIVNYNKEYEKYLSEIVLIAIDECFKSISDK